MPSPLLPEIPAPASVRVRKREANRSSQSESGALYTRKKGFPLYEVTLVYAPMKPSDFAALNAFITSRGGKNGIFYVRMPNNHSGQTGVKIGNFANYDNDTKLHLITAEGVSPETYPAARVAGGNLVANDVYLRCSLARDLHDVVVDRINLISRFEIDLIERL